MNNKSFNKLIDNNEGKAQLPGFTNLLSSIEQKNAATLMLMKALLMPRH
jgi:hypothetical protein